MTKVEIAKVEVALCSIWMLYCYTSVWEYCLSKVWT